MIHRGEQATFFGEARLAVGLPKLVVCAVAFAQDRGVEQLVVAVGDLDAADVELEAFGHRGTIFANAG